MLAAPDGYVPVFVDEGAPMALLLVAALGDDRWGRHAANVRPYAQRLLFVLHSEGIAPLDSAQPPRSHSGRMPSGEVLTEREVEVLRLLAAGRSNAAIADQLIVAVGTVKRHVNSIMGKLQVHSRLEAVARARELDLV